MDFNASPYSSISVSHVDLCWLCIFKEFFLQLQTLSNTLVHILMHRLQSLATLTGVQWCLAVVLPCTSLMARDGEHLPTRQFGISPGEVFSPFAQTTDLKLFVSLLLRFQCSLYSLGNRFFFFFLRHTFWKCFLPDSGRHFQETIPSAEQKFLILMMSRLLFLSCHRRL